MRFLKPVCDLTTLGGQMDTQTQTQTQTQTGKRQSTGRSESTSQKLVRSYEKNVQIKIEKLAPQ
jgi:hypothetical protein